jgi:hypothetical protein
VLYLIPKYLDKFKYSKGIINSFINLLIAKMIQINFTKNIKKFDLNIESLPQKIRQNYKDELNDWRNILEHIFFISTWKTTPTLESDDPDIQMYHDLLVSQVAFNYYLELEKGICKIINGLKTKQIHTHHTVSFGSVRGEIDILCDDTIIEIKSAVSDYNEIATTPNICQVLLYGYLLKKREHPVNRIILYNPLSGETNNIDISEFNLLKFKKTIYND